MNRLIIYYLLLFVTISACQQDINIEESIQKDITIEEVKTVFNARKTYNTNSRTSDSKNSMDIVWDLAIYKELNIGDALFFPVKSNFDEEGKKYVSSGEGTNRFPIDYTSFGRAYKDESGEVVLDYIMPVPTENTPEFTGYFLVSDWGGIAKRILTYENGILVKEEKVSEQQINNGKNNRSKLGCTQYDYWWCVDVYVDGEIRASKCTHEYSEIICTNPQPISDLDPGTGSETGSTGGSSSGSIPEDGSLCYHPFIESMLVDCDEVICSDEGFVVDENGNCVPSLKYEDVETFELCYENLSFISVGNSYTADITGLGATVWNNLTGQLAINVEFGNSCISIPKSFASSSSIAAQYFSEIYNYSRKKLYLWVNSTYTPLTSFSVRNKLLEIIRQELNTEFSGSEFNIGSGCSGNIPVSVADYGC
jgi:hypothetical protein